MIQHWRTLRNSWRDKRRYVFLFQGFNQKVSAMAGFRKAKAEQAALKMGFYGPPGSGKTFTALLVAEGLAQLAKKRVAFVDTEHGTDFYCKDVANRQCHPAAFDFDTIYTRALTEITAAVKGLKEQEYGVVVIDSVTHLWEAARAAYAGKTTSVGTIPMHAWGKIKKPYKDLISFLLSSPMHVILCGRQGIEYETDEETEELKAIGVKMKAEGETAYEPHILIRMEAIKPKKTNEVAQIVAYIEKDRTGVLSGRSFINPTFQSLAAPVMGLLGGKQAHMQTDDEASQIDAEKLAEEERKRLAESAKLLAEWSAKITLADSETELKEIGRFITPQLKAQMLPMDVSTLRERYLEREGAVRRNVPKEPEPSSGDLGGLIDDAWWKEYGDLLAQAVDLDAVARVRDYHSGQVVTPTDLLRVTEMADGRFAALAAKPKGKAKQAALIQ